jgi:hypothetical protein
MSMDGVFAEIAEERLVVPDDMDLWDIAVAVVRGKLTLSL